jgi:hypothetical protein
MITSKEETEVQIVRTSQDIGLSIQNITVLGLLPPDQEKARGSAMRTPDNSKIDHIQISDFCPDSQLKICLDFIWPNCQIIRFWIVSIYFCSKFGPISEKKSKRAIWSGLVCGPPEKMTHFVQICIWPFAKNFQNLSRLVCGLLCYCQGSSSGSVICGNSPFG